MSVSPPSEPLLMWATTDTNLPNLAGPNKVKPIDDLIAKGWDFKQKPCADEFNYILNNHSLWIDYVADLIESVTINGAIGIAETAAKLAITRNITLQGDVTGTVGFDGSTNVAMNTSVTDNSHSHVSANITDATPDNTADKIIKRDGNGSFAANKGYVNHLIINKVNGVSEIVFPSNNTDPAFIQEVEVGADISHMRFSVSDNGNGEDKFAFGSTNGGVWTPKTVIDTAGNIDTEGTIVASGAITAPRFNGTASAADRAYPRRSDGGSLNFFWNGQGGQPTWLWGGNDGVNMYVYNPSNFSVNYANGAGYANTAGNADTARNATNHINTNGSVHGATSGNSPGNLMTRDINGDVAARTFVGDLMGTASYASTATNNVVVLSGTLPDGGTIPLPSGYAEWQCNWLVSMRDDNAGRHGWDPREGLSAIHYRQECYTSGRTVIARSWVYNDSFDTTDVHPGQANYIVIGVK